MATTKITVTVPEDLAEHIRARVAAGDFDSISAYVTKAAETLRDVEPLDLLIASMIAETGEPDEAAQAWAAAAMDVARRAAESSTGTVSDSAA